DVVVEGRMGRPHREGTTVKYMLIMRATEQAKAAYENLDFEEVINAMGAYNESMMKAGVLLAGEGLAEPDDGFIVDFESETPIVTDGPYGETHELFNGFWIIEVSSKEEAVQWASRAPLGPGNKLEVRRVTDEADFTDHADNEYIQKEAGWREQLGTS
ncbi:MAG: YciI family protein, partial [Nitriliruptor sp.]